MAEKAPRIAPLTWPVGDTPSGSSDRRHQAPRPIGRKTLFRVPHWQSNHGTGARGSRSRLPLACSSYAEVRRANETGTPSLQRGRYRCARNRTQRPLLNKSVLCGVHCGCSMFQSLLRSARPLGHPTAGGKDPADLDRSLRKSSPGIAGPSENSRAHAQGCSHELVPI